MKGSMSGSTTLSLHPRKAQASNKAAPAPAKRQPTAVPARTPWETLFPREPIGAERLLVAACGVGLDIIESVALTVAVFVIVSDMLMAELDVTGSFAVEVPMELLSTSGRAENDSLLLGVAVV